MDQHNFGRVSTAYDREEQNTVPFTSPPPSGTEAGANGQSGEKKKRGRPRKGEAETNHVRSKLDPAIRRMIIEKLATFHTVKQTIDAVAKAHNITLAYSTVQRYDVTSREFAAGKKVREQFNEIRAAYVEDAKAVAIAHQAHRLRKLEAIIESATKSKDYGSALKGIELAAKEMGGLAQTVKHEGMVRHAHLHSHSVEDARQEVTMRLAQLLEGQLGQAQLEAPATGTVDSVATEEE